MRTLVYLLILFHGTLAHALDTFSYRVMEKQPQSRALFTQGLEIHDKAFFVSSGQYGKSKLLRIDAASGEVQLERRLSRAYFAEGLTLLNNNLYQLTWQNRVMLVYDAESFEPLHKFKLPGEGWGLTNDGENLIYSDGTAQLHFVDARTGRRLNSLTVTENGKPLSRLNELEWVNGAIWANVWLTNRLVMIDPASGKVTATVNLKGLLPDGDRRRDTDVLNGIAYDNARDAIWVTGKRWPWRFRIQLVPEQGSPATDSR